MFWNYFNGYTQDMIITLTVNMKCFEIAVTNLIDTGEKELTVNMKCFEILIICILLLKFLQLTVNMKCFEIFLV